MKQEMGVVKSRNLQRVCETERRHVCGRDGVNLRRERKADGDRCGGSVNINVNMLL